MTGQVWTSTSRGLIIRLRVIPKASRNGIAGFYENADGVVSLKVTTTAQPEKGKANKAVITILSKRFRQPKSRFSVIHGETDRNKTILIDGDSAEVKSWLLPVLKEVKND